MSISERLMVVLDPRFWIGTGSVDAAWDRKLNQILDQIESGEISAGISGMRLATKTIDVWIGNFPYGYGSMAAPASLDLIPKRRTALRLKDVVLRVACGEFDNAGGAA